MRASRAENQRRFRARTDKLRIEVYLAPQIVAALDAMPGTRSEIIAALVEGAKQPPEHDESTTTGSRPYRFRRPKPTESSLDWIMIVDGEPWAELERYKPGLYPMWRARTLKRSLTWRWCKGKSRAGVAERLYDKPDIWQ